jgi:hypothetical protein
MSSTTATAPGLAGAWFGELASALQGKWQAVAASGGVHGEQRPRQQPKLGGGALGERSGKAAAKEAEEVGRCGGAMSDATLYLLLDRFAPN